MKRITYEYLCHKFIEDNKGFVTHVDDNGNIVWGYWTMDWCDGAEEVEDDKVHDRVETLSRITCKNGTEKLYRNIKID